MDWLRRNWPDLLIGLALIAVIAGIVATLLTGGSFFPLGGGSGPTVAPPPASTAPAESAPADDGAPAAGAIDEGPGVAVLPPSDDGAEGDGLPPGAPAPDAGAERGAEAGADAGADAGAEAPAVAPVAPDDPTASDAADVADAADAPAAAPPSDAEAVAAAPDAPPEAAPAPRATPDPPASDALPTEPYRVSVGAFASRENAETLAARFREADYPVFLAPQGELTLVLVGPYDDAARARATADEIRDGPYGIDPVVYEFRPDGGPAAAAPAADPEVGDPEVGDPEVGDAPATPDAAATPTPAAGPVEPAAEDAAPRADATASGTLLQLGAYADRDGAAPQIERLARLGFDVETIREDGLVKLLIGPLSSAELEDARVILDGAGVEYFAR